jgi:hypothetical protein
MQPSVLFLNMSYPCGAWSRDRWWVAKLVTPSDCSFRGAGQSTWDGDLSRLGLFPTRMGTVDGLVAATDRVSFLRCRPAPDTLDRRVGVGEFQALPADRAAGANRLRLGDLADCPSN